MRETGEARGNEDEESDQRLASSVPPLDIEAAVEKEVRPEDKSGHADDI